MGNLIGGNHAVFLVNGMPYAYISKLDPTILSPQKELRGIDYLLPCDLAPGPVSYSVSATLYRKRQGGGLEGDGFLPRWRDATRGKYFSAIVVDRRTQEILFQTNKSLITSQSWAIGPKALVIGQIQWIGLDYSNDSETLLS